MAALEISRQEQICPGALKLRAISVISRPESRHQAISRDKLSPDSGLIGSITSWGTISNNISAAKSIGELWAFSDISGNVTSGVGVLSITSWGSIEGDIAANGEGSDISVSADGQISGNLSNSNGGITVESWKDITGNLTATNDITAWADGSITGDINSSAGAIIAEAWSNISGKIVGQLGIEVAAVHDVLATISSITDAITVEAGNDISGGKFTAASNIDVAANHDLRANLNSSHGGITAESWHDVAGSILIAANNISVWAAHNITSVVDSLQGSVNAAAVDTVDESELASARGTNISAADGMASVLLADAATGPTTGPTTAPAARWHILRYTKPTADATSNKGDTIAELAETIGLDATEFQNWLSHSGQFCQLENGTFVKFSSLKATDKLAAGERFSIPYTIIDAWVGWEGPLKLGKGAVKFKDDIQSLSLMGYDVEVHDLDEKVFTPDQLYQWFKADSSSKSLQGFLLTGHGNETGFSNDINNSSFDADFAKVKKSLSYGLGLVILNICDGGWSINDANNPSRKSVLGAGIGGRDLASKTALQHGWFYGIRKTLIPIIETKHPDDLLKPGDQGTFFLPDNPTPPTSPKPPIWRKGH